MRRANMAICGFLAFEAVCLAGLFFVAACGVDEFRSVDPAGWWPLFVGLKSLSACAFLTGGSLAAGWGLARLLNWIAARRVAAVFDVA